MNNLNEPPRWNIRPERRGDDGGKWNYALLLPMLGLAAFRWIWTRESQREIRDVKAGYDRGMTAVIKDLEMKYGDTLTENRRAAARLELELEKERQRVAGFRQALASQSQKLLEERRQLQQEREVLEKERRQHLESNAAGVVLHDRLKQEGEWHRRATSVLQELEEELVERQNAFCSILLPRSNRLEMEKTILLKAVKDPLSAHVDLETDLKDIFKNDRHCKDRLDASQGKNGSLMWLYLRYWQLLVTLQKHKRAEKSLMGVQPHPK